MNAELTELNRIGVIRNEHEHGHVNADMFWLILCDPHPLLGCSQITRGSLTTRIAISSSVIFIIVGIFRIGENSLWKLATMLKCQNHGWSLLQKCLMRKYVAIIEVRNLKQCLTTTYSVFVAFSDKIYLDSHFSKCTNI